ncbi:hypothetical protein DFQ27_000590 [Actinomortierella ambigua]|uniref:Methyltransferase type 11 domain-containing protein n=1 Tax=Actinomortierella ambigua TaxID=1343610 RepID=A0A9P6U9P2_9FUNG|nr:hypothetical protein DFQ27_000590 [Actinomortierella ambigua]
MVITTAIEASSSADHWSSKKYVKNASFVPALGTPVLDLLNPQSHERILDLGAGDGVLTVRIQERCQSVIATDASAAMIEAAKRNGCKDARVVDGHDLVNDPGLATGEFDAVFSNADPSKVVEGVAKCLKPGGRFVAECGGFLNCATVRIGLHAALRRRGVDPSTVDPWFFPAPATYKAILEKHGFVVKYIELIPRHTQLNTDVAGWIDTFGFTFLEPLDEEDRKRVAQEVQDELQVSCQREDGVWFMDYVRLRFECIKP